MGNLYSVWLLSYYISFQGATIWLVGDSLITSDISLRWYYIINFSVWHCFLSVTLFRLRGTKKNSAPTSFSPVTSTNVGTSPKNFLTFTFNPFAHWCIISRPYLAPGPNYWTWTKTTPRKKGHFWSNSYEIEVMITSLIEMLELPYFGQITTSTI